MTLPEPGLLGPVHGILRKNAGKPVNPELVESLIQQARHVLDQGRRAEEALALLTDLDKSDMTAEVKCLQGRCFLDLNKKPMALAAFLGALKQDSNNVDALLGCAAVYQSCNQLKEALECLKKARKAPASTSRPEVPSALAAVLTDLGTAEKLLGLPAWKDRYLEALKVYPRHPQAHYNLGVAAGEAGQADEAVTHYRRAVEYAPLCAEAWCNLGVILRSQGKLEEALEAYERSYQIAPNNEVIRMNLAVTLSDRGSAIKLEGRQTEAIACYERALALHPFHGESMYNLGVAAMEKGHLDRAIFMYESAIRALPNCAEAHNNLGVVHREQGNIERAIACYQAALNVRPNFPQGLNNLAVIYTARGQAKEALDMLHTALTLAPDYAEAWNNLGVLQRDVGASVDAITSYDKCLALDPYNRNAGQNRLLSLNYVHHGEEEFVCEAHRVWGQRFQELHPLLAARTPMPEDAGRVLRVGYISPDLFTHSVSYFAQVPITMHNRDVVSAVVYSCCSKGDEKTARLRTLVLEAGHVWRDVAALSEKELAEQVRADKIDILVELTGHTAHNRLGAMAMRPAPVQVTWIGYPNSTGLETIDYRITDARCDPEDTQQTFTERLVRMPGCFLCYTPAPDLPPIAPLPALSNGYVTFGSFNALAKETPQVLKVWANILLAVPRSRLILKNKPLACDSVRQGYWRVFEELGVERHRIDLLPLAPGNREHMAQYALMDVALDPWPYAGTTTTTEAFVMGVPCVTMAGKCHAHNVGVSLVQAVGLPAKDWVAHTEDEYVAAAVRAVGDLKALALLRKELRDQMLASDMCNGPKFVRQLEAVYKSMWRTWLDQAMTKAALC